MFSDVVFDCLADIKDKLPPPDHAYPREAVTAMLEAMVFVVNLSDQASPEDGWNTSTAREMAKRAVEQMYAQRAEENQTTIPDQRVAIFFAVVDKSIAEIGDRLTPDCAFPEVYPREAVIDMFEAMLFIKYWCMHAPKGGIVPGMTKSKFCEVSKRGATYIYSRTMEKNMERPRLGKRDRSEYDPAGQTCVRITKAWRKSSYEKSTKPISRT